ncbi:MAG: type secretion system protein [Gemmatimonadetes bacterium]|nr:type secretion system protein [Gemmatimonadota bacterium]
MAFLAFTFVGIIGLIVAGYALVVDQRRKAVLERAFGDASGESSSALLSPPPSPMSERLRALVGRVAPAGWISDDAVRERMLRAGREDEEALVHYAATRMVLVVVMPVAALLIMGVHSLLGFLMTVLLGAAAGWITPAALLDGQIRRRQDRIRAAIPDTLDLMLVCVEAGISLESAMMRVSREMAGVHPDMSYELAVALRRMKAGMTRDDALRALYSRTGVEELRSVAANIVQSERWGTGIARVLRMTADTLRRRRRQLAEKRAQTVAVKMTLPLVLMILPSLFIALLGPTVISLIQTFGSQ